MPSPELFALVPTRQAFAIESHPGTAFLSAAGFDVRLLAGHSSIFEAYETGVARLSSRAPGDSVVVLVHDDVAFQGVAPSLFAQLVRQQLRPSGVGFVGVAGCRTLRHNLAWWRNASGATALAGMVHHGQEQEGSEGAFFGPPGRVAMLDGVLLAATLRTLRSVRLAPPAGIEGLWHFYDLSYTLQAHAAGRTNVALPLGVRHRSKGSTDAAWERARSALAPRLHPLLPAGPSDEPAPRPHRRLALLLRTAEAEVRLSGSADAARDALREAGYKVLEVHGRRGARQRRDGGGAGGEVFRLIDGALGIAPTAASAAAAVAALASLAPADTLLIATTDALPITPGADLDWFVEAALGEPRTLASPLGCTASPCGDGGASAPDPSSSAPPSSASSPASTSAGESAQAGPVAEEPGGGRGQAELNAPARPQDAGVADVGCYMNLDEAVPDGTAASSTRYTTMRAECGRCSP